MIVGESRQESARVGSLGEVTGSYGWLQVGLESALEVVYDGEEECRGSKLGVP